VRCDGQRPACRVSLVGHEPLFAVADPSDQQTCVSSGRECEWPLGRKRKRTKREKLDEARRQQEAAALGEIAYPLLEMAQGRGARVTDTSQLPMGLQHPIETQLPLAMQEPLPSSVSGVSGNSPPAKVFDPLPSSIGTDTNVLPDFDSGTQTAFLRGEPGQDADLELYYYRLVSGRILHLNGVGMVRVE
jgi:hypothetical protein